MSLCKQIQILITLLVTAMLIAVLKINLDSTRSLMTAQMSHSTQNTADLLALSLSAHLSNQTRVKSDIDRIFENGHFAKIALTLENGEILHQRNRETRTAGVPVFFQNYVASEFSAAQSPLFEENNNFGVITVTLHPGPFYTSLWTMFKRLGLIFLSIGVLASAIAGLILKSFLNALGQIKHQAEAVSENRYIINEKLYRTPELKKTVSAMNSMVAAMQKIFNRQMDDIKYYQELQFIDSVTGLHNRSFLVKRLSDFLESDAEKAHGQFLLFGFVGMEKNNMSTGHPAIQAFYKTLADIVKGGAKPAENAVTARLSQQEFGIILPNCTQEKAAALAQSIMTGILDLLNAKTELSEYIEVSGGIAPYDYNDDAGAVLSKADYALSAAKNNPSGTIELFKESTDQAIMGKYQWQTMLHTALSHNRFFLTAQPVMSAEEELHREVYINLSDEKAKIYRAGYFMPMATSLGMAGRIDKYVLERAAEHLKHYPERVLAVNITTAFCKDRFAVVWLRHFLEENRSVQKRLFFEIHDNSLIQQPEIYLDLSRILSQEGFGFGIDQFTLDETSLNLLKELKPHYIKIENDCFQNIECHVNSHIALNALLTITETLNIRLIVTKIEDQAIRNDLISKKIKYFQGYGIAAIEPL